MKKILVVMLASFVTVCAFSCTKETDTENKQNAPAEGTVTEEVKPAPETETTPDRPVVPGNDNQPEATVVPGDKTESGLVAISYEEFKEVIGYSMAPYDSPVNVEKNMVHAVTGFNGTVELSYLSFVMRENAAAYMQEIMAAFPGEPVSYEEAGNYEIWKFTADNEYYMAVRIGKTIIYGSSKKGFEPIEDWMYGFGYIEKK